MSTDIQKHEGQHHITVKSLLAQDGYKKRFEEVMGKRSMQFMASISNAASQRGLAECEPKSIIAAAFVAATLDLPIDKNLGFAHLVPYKGVCQFQIGYRGFLQLALRSGQYKRMVDAVVNEEAFQGFDDIGDPKIDWNKIDTSKPAVGYVFAWEMTNGFRKIVYWSKDKVTVHAKKYSKSFNFKDSAWQTQFDAMALKTVIKAGLARYGILSIELQRAITHDQGAQNDIETEVTFIDNEEVRHDLQTPTAIDSGDGAAGDQIPMDDPKKEEPKVDEVKKEEPPKKTVAAGDPETNPITVTLKEVKPIKTKKEGVFNYNITASNGVVFFTAEEAVGQAAEKIRQDGSFASIAWGRDPDKRLLAVSIE